MHHKVNLTRLRPSVGGMPRIFIPVIFLGNGEMTTGRVRGPTEPTMNHIWAQGQPLECANCVFAQGPHA